MMFLTYCAYLALAVCLAGIFWRVARWCVLSIGPESHETTPGQRMIAAFRDLSGVLFSRKLWVLCRTILVEILAQRRILRKSPVRWIMHMGLFYGVLLLIVAHALDDLILASLMSDYAPTLNPFKFLRNLLGLLLLTGLTIAIIRRYRIPVLRRFNSINDRVALLLIGIILLSGIGLEATQIISASVFDEMVAEYWGSDDPEEITPLKAYWADQFHVVFPSPPPMDHTALAVGRQVHMDFCAGCHTGVQAAFVALPLARAIKPLAALLESVRIDMWLWYVHYLAGCLALAYLPFGKFFHLFSVPLTLAVRGLGDTAGQRPAARPTRRAMGLDACTHCGVCSRHCSVAPIMGVIPNSAILPSEKIGHVGRMARGSLTEQGLWCLTQGSHICTGCGRCTEQCPAGIDLQDLWTASLDDLNRHGYLGLHGWIRNKTAAQWADHIGKTHQPSEIPETSSNASKVGPHFSENPSAFWACVQCTTCTTVCPVVAASDDPRRDLDMTPQQVMNLMRLELKDTALGCRMVWDCVTCYKCQEHCPQGVPVADVLYELRNEACRRLTPVNLR